MKDKEKYEDYSLRLDRSHIGHSDDEVAYTISESMLDKLISEKTDKAVKEELEKVHKELRGKPWSISHLADLDLLLIDRIKELTNEK